MATAMLGCFKACSIRTFYGVRRLVMKAFTPFPANAPSKIADMTQIVEAIRIAEIIDIDI